MIICGNLFIQQIFIKHPLYVGNISVDGLSTIRYLYSDGSVDTATLTEIGKVLTPDYTAILPTTAGQIKASNSDFAVVNDSWTDASAVALTNVMSGALPGGIISDTSTTILYNETEFENLATATLTEISAEQFAEEDNLNAWNERKTVWEENEQQKANDDQNYTPVAFPEQYVMVFNDDTAYPTTGYFISDQKTEHIWDAESGPSCTNGTNVSYIVKNGAVTEVNTFDLI